MSKFENCERFGQFLVNKIDNSTGRELRSWLYNSTNTEWQNIFDQYVNYLFKNGVCPKCFADLVPADGQVEEIHCHECEFREEHLKLIGVQ